MNFFGYTYGTSPDEYKNGYAAAAKKSGAWGLTPDHLGLRVNLSAVGWTPSGVLFNGGASNLTSIGNSDITQMSITYDGGSIDYSFPTNFRHGAVPNVYSQGEILPLSGGADRCQDQGTSLRRGLVLPRLPGPHRLSDRGRPLLHL